MADSNVQPAIKSYFFGKGYRDLGNTIKDSWFMNLVSAGDYWKKTVKFWNEGGLYMLGAVATAFAALSVVVFGTAWFLVLSTIHIVILAIFFSLIYISFSFLWLIERIYMFFRGIFVVCPFCHEKYDLPYYLCPNCKIVHTRLIPSSYGILKRTCQCGHELPTAFFNGRNKFEARCPIPRCSRTIETQETKPICIPVIGGPSVGKTCVLFAATHDLIETTAPKYSWKIRFLNQQNEDIYERVLQNFNQGVVPAKTVELTPVAFNFFVGSSRWSPEKIVYLYDSAGESFQNSDDLVSHKFYGYLHGFLFIIDPFSIPELLYEYESNLKLYGTQIKPSDLMLEDCFDTMLINLEKNHKIRRDQQINKPCAVVINKIDAFDLEYRIGESAAKSLMIKDPKIKSMEEAVNRLCEELFMEWELGNVLRKLKHKFKTYRFFTCSALGHLPDNTKQPFQPYRVTEPLMWLLGQADKDMRVKK